MSVESTREPAVAPSPLHAELVGAWRICSWNQVYDDGRVVEPLGPDPVGFIHYGRRWMQCLISSRGRDPFRSGAQWNASAQEQAGAYRTFLAYGGQYDIDGAEVIHRVCISLYPNWTGGVQRRVAALVDGRLHLVARLEDGTSDARTATLIWERIDD